jgi:hypothetical protein
MCRSKIRAGGSALLSAPLRPRRSPLSYLGRYFCGVAGKHLRDMIRVTRNVNPATHFGQIGRFKSVENARGGWQFDTLEYAPEGQEGTGAYG